MKDYIQQLIDKYLDGTITPQEEQQLMDWYEAENNTTVEWQSTAINEEEEVRLRMLQHIQQQIAPPGLSPVGGNRRWYYAAAAAVFLLILAGAAWLYYPALQRPHTAVKQLAVASNTIVRGSNKAILTLGNGQQVVLEEVDNGTISQQGNATVNKADSGSLQYLAGQGAANGAIVYNTLHTPYGGQFKVTLPDGTRVWMNAGSTLHYPTAFPSGDRTVSLSGEAYFEVAPDANKPFFVSVRDTAGMPMTISVLGTHFNVNAYPDEAQHKVTLLEGSVKVNCSNSDALLVPGKVAIVNKTTGRIRTKTTDTEAAIAWKNGNFFFDNESLESIMRQISRWYNVDIRYQADVSGKALAGSLPRSKDVTEVLSMLELTKTVHFKIEGRRIIVMP
ncbi:FecR domain-containing protein [Chitinophaga sp. CB10]|uniref:FecR family protein n=1 Tax=Chitinophaga sp. CB10 TaxID=1891659 RepID=UPI000AE36BD4|nr:FecR domain-containing protein [Chitinophaga sp. CB10]